MQDPQKPDDSSINIKGSVFGPVIKGNSNTLTFGISARQWRTIWIILTAILLIGSATIIFIVSDYWQTERATRVRVGAYTVVLYGSAAGGATFEQQGELRIRRSTDRLPYEWCLKVGNPWATPAPGAVWFGTNGTCFGNGLDEAVAHIQEKNGETLITPVDPPPTLEQSPNSFTATSGISTDPYVPDRGEVRFSASASKLEGVLSLQGLETAGRSTRGVFTATLRASLASDDPEAPISSPVEPAPYTDTKGSNSAAHKVDGKRYTVKTIISFRQLAGNPEFIKSEQARFAGAVFVIDTRQGGTFVYDPPDSRSDIFPVTGTVTSADPLYVLSGQRSSESVDAKTVIGGTLDLSGSEPTLKVTLTTTAITTNSYEIEAILQVRDV
ncbi:hypothetical protein ABT061_14755 [Streptosporangium sp. NPDC002544]|uniref:hypothetical protein n=1 Tax=Streptosporangium sp. NPDC002544 TaxID=3154538 RepID=UPI00332F41C0